MADGTTEAKMERLTLRYYERMDEIERLKKALDILQVAMTAKKPIPMLFKKAINDARAAIKENNK